MPTSDLIQPSLVLASSSPRRRELLEQIGLKFNVKTVEVKESRSADESALAYVERLARDKATAAACHFADGRCYLGADTIVVRSGRVFEKPKDETDFIAILEQLSANTHEVVTSVCLVGPETLKQATVTTQVRFRQILPEEMAWYWRSGEPKDKAGGYGIQGLGAIFVSRIEGSYSNVVGLPLFETAQLLAEVNIDCWH